MIVIAKNESSLCTIHFRIFRWHSENKHTQIQRSRKVDNENWQMFVQVFNCSFAHEIELMESLFREMLCIYFHLEFEVFRFLLATQQYGSHTYHGTPYTHTHCIAVEVYDSNSSYSRMGFLGHTSNCRKHAFWIWFVCGVWPQISSNRRLIWCWYREVVVQLECEMHNSRSNDFLDFPNYC